jgi:uncharacterized protein
MSKVPLEFPCEFPLKVMGRKSEGFRELVIGLVEAETGPLAEDNVRLRESREGNFVALTVTVKVNDQDQLDAVYRALSGHEQVLMVL